MILAREQSLSLNSASPISPVSPSRTREPTDQLTFAPGSDHLPPYRTYRVLIVPETRISGFEFLLFFLHGKSKEAYISSGFYACFCPPVVMVRASSSKSLTKWQVRAVASPETFCLTLLAGRQYDGPSQHLMQYAQYI